MRKILISTLFLGIIIGFTGCSKDDDEPAVVVTKTQLLTKESWKQVNSEVSTGGAFTSDWASWDDCDKDDLTTFKTDKTYQATEGATKCNPADPDLIDEGTWDFNSDETKLIMDVLSTTIVKLDETDLIITFKYGVNEFRISFKH